MRTWARYTTLVGTKTISPVCAFPKPKPLSTNHLSTVSFHDFAFFKHISSTREVWLLSLRVVP